MLSNLAADLSRRLAQCTEEVCRIYLPNGRRQGHYWIVGNVDGDKGQSLFVHLAGNRAGHWTDAATGEYGDLLDLIKSNRGLQNISEAIKEARSFLRDPEIRPRRPRRSIKNLPVLPIKPAPDGALAAEKLYAISHPVPGTLAETYLRSRAITACFDAPSLRFHPACYHRPSEHAPLERWPALLGVITDLDDNLTGLQRIYLARDGRDKAPFDDPRRGRGNWMGHAVRFGKAADIMALGEGIETVLSPLGLFPAMPMAAALTVAHLCAFIFPPTLRRLYVLRENDAGGAAVEEKVRARCDHVGLDCRMLRSRLKDFNDDLVADGSVAIKARILDQLHPEDLRRFGD